MNNYVFINKEGGNFLKKLTNMARKSYINLFLMKSEKGQGMTEYVLLLAFIAIAVIGVITTFGNQIKSVFTGLTNTLSGTPTAP